MNRTATLTAVLTSLLVLLLPDRAAAAGGGYWHEFLNYWFGSIKSQNGVVLTALGVGAVSLFIITRGKWKK